MTNFDGFLSSLELEYYARCIAASKICDLCVAKAYGGCYDHPGIPCVEKIIACGEKEEGD